MSRFYTGIGSRKTPADIQKQMTEIAAFMRALGFTLRSGAAQGADAAFELCAGELKEIYLPWPGFNNHLSAYSSCSAEAMAIAAVFHPAWGKLSQAAKKLMARNCYQVLGYDLKTPSECVVCWTPGGKPVGGTSQAIRIAKHHNIPVFNLGSPTGGPEFVNWYKQEADNGRRQE